MSLVSHWKSRKKWLGVRTRGRSIWWLVIVLLLVLTIMYQLDRWGEIISRKMKSPGQTQVEQDE
jgi:hypothetical protein